MQTFLPYADYEQSASVLDNRRLGKQRVETLQIVKAIVDPAYGWQHHPAVKMWRNNIIELVNYQYAICHEWAGVRGFRDTCLEKTLDVVFGGSVDIATLHDEEPMWLGDESIHLSHRSNLLRKDPSHYGPLFESGLTADLDYVWPVL